MTNSSNNFPSVDPTLIHTFNTNDEGKPHGGFTQGTGINIDWQCGPVENNSPNGAFVQTVIRVVIDRIKHYNECGFQCDENSEAIGHLRNAFDVLESRHQSRKVHGVHNTHDQRDGLDIWKDAS